MKQRYLLLILIIATQAFAFDLDVKELDVHQKYDIGQFSIIEYPKASKETFELKFRDNTLLSQTGNDVAIFHSEAKQPMVVLIDTNGDGLHDRIDYDIYDSEGRYLGTSSDRNFDGQTDLKIRVNYDNDEAKSSAFVWVKNKWYQVHENGRDEDGRIIRVISMNNEWVLVDISEYPFKLGE